jgi:hypothetical protein
MSTNLVEGCTRCLMHVTPLSFNVPRHALLATNVRYTRAIFSLSHNLETMMPCPQSQPINNQSPYSPFHSGICFHMHALVYGPHPCSRWACWASHLPMIAFPYPSFACPLLRATSMGCVSFQRRMMTTSAVLIQRVNIPGTKLGLPSHTPPSYLHYRSYWVFSSFQEPQCLRCPHVTPKTHRENPQVLPTPPLNMPAHNGATHGSPPPAPLEAVLASLSSHGTDFFHESNLNETNSV